MSSSVFSDSIPDVQSVAETSHSQEDQFVRSCLHFLARSINAIVVGIFAGMSGMLIGAVLSIRFAIVCAVVVGIGAFVMGTPGAAICTLVGTVFFSVIAGGVAGGGCVGFIIGCALGDTQWINNFR